MRFLIVDDSPIIRLVLKRLCAQYGQVDSANDGEEAFGVYAQGIDDGNPFDLICLDIQMPKWDGIEVLRKIRALESESGSAKRVRVLVITSMDDLESVRKMIGAGADQYLLKPIDQHGLAERLESMGF